VCEPVHNKPVMKNIFTLWKSYSRSEDEICHWIIRDETTPWAVVSCFQIRLQFNRSGHPFPLSSLLHTATHTNFIFSKYEARRGKANWRLLYRRPP
jgi:hypothetical protein